MPILGKDYQLGMGRSLSTAKQTIEREFPGLWKPTKACLGMYSLLKIEDVSNCCFLTLIGPPSCRKSTTLSWFSRLNSSYPTDDFSPASFVSQYAGATEKKLKEIDLLPKIVGKVLITPELMPVYSAPAESLTNLLGIITKILDGMGYSRDSGIHGQRGYKGVEGEYVFHWLAGVAYVPHRLWRMFGNMGTRAYYYMFPEEKKISFEKLADESKEDFKKKSRKCRNAVSNFINQFNLMFPEPIEWEKEKDNRATLDFIAKLALLLSSLRGNIEYQYEGEGEDAVEIWTQPVVEAPHRVNQVLYNFARGQALLHGRKYITNDDLGIVTKIALNSARTDRVNMFQFILENDGIVHTEDITEFLNVSPPIARRTLKALRILGLIDLTTVKTSNPKGGRPRFKAVLKDEFKWFTSEQFRKLRN